LIYAHAEGVYANHSRVVTAGPVFDPQHLDASTPNNTPASPQDLLDRVATYIDYDDETWVESAAFPAGSLDNFKATDGTSKDRVAYEAFALVCVQTYGDSEDDAAFEFDARLSFSLDGASASTDSARFTAVSISNQQRTAEVGRSKVAYLAGFFEDWHPANRGTLVRHALKGVWPASAWSSGRWALVRISGADDNASDIRIGSFDLKCRETPVGLATPADASPPRYLHIASLTVIEARGGAEEEDWQGV
jgi:hypothetical protein